LARTDDSQRIVDLKQAVDIAPVRNAGDRLAVNDPLGLRGSAFGKWRQQPKPAKVLADISKPDNRPLISEPAFTPENLSAAKRTTFQATRVVVLHIGELVAVVRDSNVGWASTADPGSSDFAMANRVEQNPESTEVGRMHGANATDGNAILELAFIGRRSDDRGVDCQHVEPRTILAAVVAKLDDVSLTKLVDHFGQLVVIATPSLAYRIQKRIPDFSRNMEWLASLNFLEAICHLLAFRL
jgi:hypothetical protein